MENNSKFTKIALAILLILLLGYSAYATYSILDLRNRNENIEKQLTTNNEQATTDNKNESLKVTEFTLNGEDIKLPEGWYLESIEDNPYQFVSVDDENILDKNGHLMLYDSDKEIFGLTIHNGRTIKYSNGRTNIFINDYHKYTVVTGLVQECIEIDNQNSFLIVRPENNKLGLIRSSSFNSYDYPR